MKTSELTGAALDWAVAKCEGKHNDCEVHAGNVMYGRVTSGFVYYRPSTDWAQGGPIIERERINIRPNQADALFKAFVVRSPTGLAHRHDGPTPLVAAMRCYVASKMGDDVELPKELT
jgi:hypothetical protein